MGGRTRTEEIFGETSQTSNTMAFGVSEPTQFGDATASHNTFIQKVLHWEPKTSLDAGLRETYFWIQEQHQKRKKGLRVGA
jgi:nucleoside-diphosphate-sugar epimerase